jgi:tyrosyl-tRNA synthetase
LMWNYYELATDRTEKAIAELKSEVNSGKLHPMDAKMKLGEEVVSVFHGAEAGRKAAENFQRVFRDREAPTEVPVQKLACGPPTKVSTLLVVGNLAPSRSEAERLIKQGAVEVDGKRVIDVKQVIDVGTPCEFLIRAGKTKFKRFIFLVPNDPSSEKL